MRAIRKTKNERPEMYQSYLKMLVALAMAPSAKEYVVARITRKDQVPDYQRVTHTWIADKSLHHRKDMCHRTLALQ